ncbi:hypothetical protein [Bradyrhizobium diazoefficiens]|nr:hypothetical protein XF15B_24120 [Bradyrhizobium diazoefficiens]
MAVDTKPVKRVKRKRRRKPREEIVDYVVEIDGWDWGYSFSLNMERQPIDPYHEFRHLQIAGRLMTPTGLKTDRVEISLLPSPELVEEKRKELTPIALGSLSLGPDGVLGNIGIPWDALTPILQMLIAGRFRFVLMRGARFRHRSAKLNSLRLETKLTEDDPLPEEWAGGPPAAGLQDSPGPEKIEVGGVVRGAGKGRSAAEGREV